MDPTSQGIARNRTKVVEAALKCLEKDGVQRTTMTGIAAAAGISRMTLYRLFEDRSALFEQILGSRFATLLDLLRRKLADYDTLAEALVEGGVRALQLGLADALVREIVTQATDHHLETFLLNNTPELRAAHIDMWCATFARARTSGELTSPLPDERLIEGVRSILNLLLLRTDLDEAGQRAFLTDFLIPAICGGGAYPPAPSPSKASARR